MVPDYDSDNDISEVEATNINVDGPSDWNRVEVQDCAPEAPQTLETSDPEFVIYRNKLGFALLATARLITLNITELKTLSKL